MGVLVAWLAALLLVGSALSPLSPIETAGAQSIREARQATKSASEPRDNGSNPDRPKPGNSGNGIRGGGPPATETSSIRNPAPAPTSAPDVTVPTATATPVTLTPEASGDLPAACVGIAYRNRVDVSNASELQGALSNAIPGDMIVLADGVYAGAFRITTSGTNSNRITLCGTRNSVLDRGSTSGSNALEFASASHWTVAGISIRGGTFSVWVHDYSNYITLQGIDAGFTGQSVIHVASFSSGFTLNSSVIHDGGLNNPEFGEGIYVGTNNRWWTNGQPDRSDSITITNNHFGPNIRAEAVDIKEGSTGGVVAGNFFDGTGMVVSAHYVDSWVDIKGNDYRVINNHGVQTLKHPEADGADAFEVTASIDGWGERNYFAGNAGDATNQQGGAGRYAFFIPSSLQGKGNVIACGQPVTNIETYSYPACTP